MTLSLFDIVVIDRVVKSNRSVPSEKSDALDDLADDMFEKKPNSVWTLVVITLNVLRHFLLLIPGLIFLYFFICLILGF